MLPIRAVRHRGTALFLLAALSGAAACGSDGATSPKKTPTPTGTYALRQVDQKAPPAEIYHGPYFDAANQHFYNQLVVTVTGGGIELDELNHFSFWIDLSYLGDGVRATKRVSLDGTYELQGSLVIVHVPNAPAAGFTIDSGQIVQAIDLMGKGDVAQYTFKK